MDRFRLVGVLGSGGMGRVFLGRAPDGAAVAVKVVHPHLMVRGRNEFQDRFVREVRSAQAVDGAFTAAVVAADPHADVPWLATEFVPGIPLGDAVARFGPLPEESLCALARGLFSALAAIHAAGLVHRDIKPSNIMLAVDGPKVIDFGIARLADATGLTQTGHTVGTLGFMAPEQFEHSDVPPASDVFSAGAVLAYAATGRAPFPGDSVPVLLRNLTTQPPDLDGVPHTFLPLLEAALAKDPAERPSASTARAVVPVPPTQVGPDTGWLPPAVTTAILRAAADVLRAPAAEPATGAGEHSVATMDAWPPVRADASPPDPSAPQAQPRAEGGPADPENTEDEADPVPDDVPGAQPGDHKALRGFGRVLTAVGAYVLFGWFANHGDPPHGMDPVMWILSAISGVLGVWTGLDSIFEAYHPDASATGGRVFIAFVLAVAGFVCFAAAVT
ncbi:serine/threonine-protein kinase [Yinghuangia seranimata]|uniref:serine/threonine-protein kinase n=1 Tax=Yinghuangia seranimata TaxID=408067 RepID=UPI00248A90DC|nr:serine/threonine protein kinase [Yinghuangia seranimata]MDI2129081.1 protein kinase [Yinghuangia seranimata]